MAARTIEELLVLIDASTQGLREELRKAEQVTERSSDRIEKATQKASRSFGGWGKAAEVARHAAVRIAQAVAAATVAVAAFAVRGVRAGDQLIDTAGKLGTTATALEGLRFAAEQTGVAQQSLDMGLQRMTRRVAEAAKGMGEARGALVELGLDAQELVRLPLEQQFLAIADAMAKVQSPSDRIRLGFKLFDSEGVALINTLAAGREELVGFFAEAERLGLALTGTQQRVTSEASDAIDKMQSAFRGLSLQLGATFGPAIEAAADFITNLTAKVTEALPQLAAYITHLLGIERAAADLAMRGVEAELSVNRKELEETRRDIAELEAAGGAIDVRGRVNALREKELDLVLRIYELDRRRAELEKTGDKPEAGALTGTGDGGTSAPTRTTPRVDPFMTQLPAGQAGPTLPLEPGLDELARIRSEAAQRASREEFEQLQQDLRRQEEVIEASYQRRLQIILANTEKGSEAQAEQLRRLDEQTQQQLSSIADKGTNAFSKLGEDMGRSIQDVLAGAFMGVETDFGDMLKRMAIQAATSQLFSVLGGLGGPVGKIFGFLGFDSKAGGGDLRPGIPTIVGEKGPELIVSRNGGHVIPNHMLRGGGLTVNVDARGATDPAAVERAVERGVRAAVQISGAQTQAMIGGMFRPSMA